MSPKCRPFQVSSNMATKIFQKILSIFYPLPTKKEEPHSSRTINRVFGDWATSAVEDLPPPYTDSPESKSHSQNEKLPSSPPFVCPRLQICPHEMLSFEDLQKVADSLTTRNADETIDALTQSCHEHRSQIDPAVKEPKSVCVSSPGLLRGFGTYASEDSKDPAHAPGVALLFHWDLGSLDSMRGQVENAAELRHFLSADGIRLCPHKQISDSDVVNAIYAFVTRQSEKEVFTSCDCCNTEIKVSSRMEGDDQTCRVTTKRYLGTLERPDDPVWLAQCGV